MSKNFQIVLNLLSQVRILGFLYLCYRNNIGHTTSVNMFPTKEYFLILEINKNK